MNNRWDSYAKRAKYAAGLRFDEVINPTIEWINDIIENVKRYNKSSDLDFIMKAYNFANDFPSPFAAPVIKVIFIINSSLYI